MFLCRYNRKNPALQGRATEGAKRNSRGISGEELDRTGNSAALAGVHRNWRAMLSKGLAAGDLPPKTEAEIEAHQRTGRPRGGGAFVASLERQTGLALARRKPGPKPRSKKKS